MVPKFAATALLAILFSASLGIGQEKAKSSLENALKSLIGTWELTKGKEGVRTILEFEPVADKKGLWLTTTFYEREGKEDDLRSIHGGGVVLQEDKGKVFFKRAKQPIHVQFKGEKLILCGEYQWLGVKFDLTGEYKKLEKNKEKK